LITVVLKQLPKAYPYGYTPFTPGNCRRKMFTLPSYEPKSKTEITVRDSKIQWKKETMTGKAQNSNFMFSFSW
jgi:hypothetical protein